MFQGKLSLQSDFIIEGIHLKNLPTNLLIQSWSIK